MSVPERIAISTALERLTNPNIDTADFKLRFEPGLQFKLNDDKYYYAFYLEEGYVWYTVPNISVALGNNQWSYSNPVLQGPYTIPDGTYSFPDLNDVIHEQMFVNGDYTGTPTNPVFPIDIIADTNQIRVVIAIKSPGYSFDIIGKMSRLTGFPVGNYAVTTVSPNKPDITMGVDTIYINASIIKYGSSYLSSNPSQNFYSFSYNTEPGALQVLNPFGKKSYVEISSKTDVNEIRIYFTDPIGRVITFRDEDVNLVLRFKKFLRY